MITAANVINMSKKEAETESTTTGTTVQPKITSRTDAQEEAKRLTTNNQALIGAKEGVILPATTLFPATTKKTDTTEHTSVLYTKYV
jgi:hypothetical protein